MQSAQAAGALLQKAHEPKQSGGGEAMIEHLQENAVEGGSLFGGGCDLVVTEAADREKTHQAITEVVDRGIGEHALEVFLSKGSAGRENNGDDR